MTEPAPKRRYFAHRVKNALGQKTFLFPFFIVGARPQVVPYRARVRLHVPTQAGRQKKGFPLFHSLLRSLLSLPEEEKRRKEASFYAGCGTTNGAVSEVAGLAREIYERFVLDCSTSYTRVRKISFA